MTGSEVFLSTTIMLLVGAFIIYIVKRLITPLASPSATESLNDPKEPKLNPSVNALRQLVEEINQTKKLPVIKTNLLLKAGEEAHLQTSSNYYEVRAARKSAGGAVRVMKGVYIGGSTSRSHDEMRQLDSGHLILTSQRLIFDGGSYNNAISLDKIFSVKQWSDALEIGIEGKAKAQIYTVDNPAKWGLLVEIAKQTRDGVVPNIDLKFE